MVGVIYILSNFLDLEYPQVEERRKGNISGMFSEYAGRKAMNFYDIG